MIYYKIVKFKNQLIQEKCIEDIIYLQLTEMEEQYVRFQRVHIQKYVDR